MTIGTSDILDIPELKTIDRHSVPSTSCALTFPLFTGQGNIPPSWMHSVSGPSGQGGRQSEPGCAPGQTILADA